MSVKVAQLLGLWGPWAAPNVQGHRLPLQQEFWSDQSLFLIGYGDGYTYV